MIPNDPIKLIGVGKAGSGKTINALSDCPRPCLVANTDRKLHTMEYLFRKKMVKQLEHMGQYDPREKLIQHIQIESKGFEQMFRHLQEMLQQPPMAEDGTPGTFGLDSLTTIADNAIYYGMSMRGGGGKSMGVVPIPDWPEWLGESMFLSSLFTDCKDLPCNVVLLAHLTTVAREVMQKGGPPITKETQTLVTGGTKIAAKIPVWFDEVYYFQAIPNTDPSLPPSRRVFTQPVHECDIARTKLPLPFSFDITYPYTEGESKPLWDYIREAQAQADEWRGEVKE